MNIGVNNDVKKSFIVSIPIAFGYIPLGFVCGVLMQQAGLSVFQIALMSFLVFAGSAQFVMSSMMVGGASYISIIMATFIINLRHMLYSSNLSTYIRNNKLFKLLMFSHFITDETFAVNNKNFSLGSWDFNKAFFLGIFSNMFWIFGNVIGGVFGEFISVPIDIASFVLTSMFIMLLVFQIKSRTAVVVCIISFIISCIFNYYFNNGLTIVISTIICSIFGFFIEKKVGE